MLILRAWLTLIGAAKSDQLASNGEAHQVIQSADNLANAILAWHSNVHGSLLSALGMHQA